ncbi:MAG TPA: ABC transporter ATP-binding protein [Devosiaceae bacterium]
MSEKLLQLNGLCVRYSTRVMEVDAAKDVTFAVDRCATVGLVGESGSGKTTTALALMGMLREPGRVVSGSAVFDGVDLASLSPEAHAAFRLRRIAYVPQGAMNSLNPVIRVRSSLAHVFKEHGVRLTTRELDQRAAELMDRVGLGTDVLQRFPHELSGGMKQRVCIAIATALGPDLIIADEPTSALDVVTQRQIMETLQRARAELKSSMILIGHDMGLMAQSVESVVVMQAGQVVEQGPVRQIFAAPRAAYTKELIGAVPRLDEDPPARTSSASPAARRVADHPLLEFKGVSKVYQAPYGQGGEVVALKPIDLVLGGKDPQIISIVGQSGSGKTTLASLVLGFSKPSSGDILFDGVSTSRMSEAQLREYRRHVQAVFQDPYSTFNPFYRVDRTLRLPLKNFGIARTQVDAQPLMEEACAKVGLNPGEILDRFAHQLSGGQRQRLMVARALMLRPRLLVADEPVSMVDASLRVSILDAIRSLRDEHGISIIYITHDLVTAHRVSDHVIVLHKGDVVEAGKPAQVLRHPSHPYTKLLVGSVPWPDPDITWGDGADVGELTREIAALPRRPVRTRSEDGEFMVETCA